MATNSTSFTRTPQAGDDVYNLTEDQLLAMGYTGSKFMLDVMSNDLGGNAKQLFSVDDGNGNALNPTDLLQADGLINGVSAWQATASGNLVRINNGKVEFDVSHSLTASGATGGIDSLGATDVIQDSFVYAIRLGNGTLSWATVRVNISGSNDAATISASNSEDIDVVEAGGVGNAATGDAMASGTLTVHDVDGGENHFAAVPAESLTGAYGDFSFNSTTGAWTFTLDQGKADALVAGQQVSQSLNVQSADGTASQTITVNITGSNDAAVLSADIADLTEADNVAAISTSGVLTISDVDSDETFVAQTETTGTYGKFSIDQAGAWTYTAASAHDEFQAGVTYTDSFSVASADGTLTSVTVSILGTNDEAVLSSDIEHLTETNEAADISTSGTLTISDVDSDETFVARTDADGTYGKFSIDESGAWTYTADDAHDEFVKDQVYTDIFTVASADGTTTTVTVNITGSNDAAVITGSSTAALDETDAAQSTSGKLDATDVDSSADFVEQSDAAGSSGYGTFSIDAGGAWTYTMNDAHDEFVGGVDYTDSITVATADGTEKVITVNMTGTNDAAVITGDSTAALGETDAAQTTGGTLLADDVDNTDNVFQAQTSVAGSNGYGMFSIDTAGAWSYTMDSAHDEFVEGVAYTDSITVKSEDGTEHVLTATITGSNDAAVLSSATKNLTEADAAADISTGGTLTISDVDSDDTFVAQTGTQGTHGKFSIDEAGAWTYTADSAHDEFQDGVNYIDSFSVASADGTLTNVMVDILGTNDAAVLSSDTKNLSETNLAADIGSSGTLSISDVDSAEAFVEQTDTNGTYGKFSIDEAGAWTYVADNAHNEFVKDQVYTDSFEVLGADGTATSVTVNITGTNDAALITGASTASLTETNAAQSTGGDLNATDVDSPATFVAQGSVAGNNGYGTFGIDATGAWTYTMNSAHDEFVAGTNYTDSMTVATADGTQQVITVTIAGTADGPVAAPAVFTGTGDANDFDSIDAAYVASAPVNFSGTGNTQDTVHGSNSADTISGNDSADTLYGNGGNDNLSGGNQADLIYGGSGVDTISGGNQADTIYAGSGGDIVNGNDQVDVIYGGSGNDAINGAAGSDTLIGGYGADQLTGGVGSDTFKFLDTRDTGDTMSNFSGTGAEADKIDLSAIDANTTTAANDSFAYVGNSTTLSAHSLIWFLSDNGSATTADDFTVVQVDTDGNAATAELQLQITATTPLVLGDFLL